jgi:hypothetical protein
MRCGAGYYPAPRLKIARSHTTANRYKGLTQGLEIHTFDIILLILKIL